MFKYFWNFNTQVGWWFPMTAWCEAPTSILMDTISIKFWVGYLNVPDDCDHMALSYRQWCHFSRSCHFPISVMSHVSTHLYWFRLRQDYRSGSYYTSNRMNRCSFLSGHHQKPGKVCRFPPRIWANYTHSQTKIRICFFLLLQTTTRNDQPSFLHPKERVKCGYCVARIWFRIQWETTPPFGRCTDPFRTPRSRQPVADRPAANSQADWVHWLAPSCSLAALGGFKLHQRNIFQIGFPWLSKKHQPLNLMVEGWIHFWPELPMLV